MCHIHENMWRCSFYRFVFESVSAAWAASNAGQASATGVNMVTVCQRHKSRLTIRSVSRVQEIVLHDVFLVMFRSLGSSVHFFR